MSHHILVRPAEIHDVDAMYDFFAPYAEKRIILPRSRDDLFQHLQEFLVAEYDGKVVGAVALHIYASNLAEIRSLVIDPAHQSMGIGRMLVEGAERVAAGLGLASVFALTYVDKFFIKLGYSIVSRESLPQKVWTVCIHCDKFSHCDEIAVQKRLSDAPIEPMNVIPILEVVAKD